MKLTLTIGEVVTLHKLAFDRIRDISESSALEADRRNINQLSSLMKLCKKLKRQTDYDKDKRRRKEKDKGKAGGNKGTAPDGTHPVQSASGRTDTGEQRIEYKA